MKKIDKIIYSDKTPDKNSLWAKKQIVVNENV